MSRRTKLLITALFLLLSAIPLGYLAITWSPTNPLEFRLIEVTPSNADPSVPGTLILTVEMENTSRVPIHAYKALLHLPTRDTGFVDIYRAAPYVPGQSGAPSLALRPGEVRRCTGVLTRISTADQTFTGAMVEYTWISETKWQAFKSAYWLSIRFPFVPEGLLQSLDDESTTSPLLE